MRETYRNFVRTQAPLGHWPLGSAHGAEMISGNHFTSLPTPRRASTDMGDFSRLYSHATTAASDSYARAAVLTATNNFTLCCWMRHQMAARHQWTWENQNGASNGYLFQARFADGRVWSVAQGVALLETSARPMPSGQWVFWVGGRWSNVWQYWWFGEGGLFRMDTGANTNAPTAPSSATMAFRAGNGVPTAGGGYVDVMDLQVYTRALTQSEMRMHGQMGMPDDRRETLGQIVQARFKPKVMTVF